MNIPASPKPPKTVLCVDDDPDDQEIVCEVIKAIDPSVNVICAENGFIAHQFLTKAKEKKEFPCLIILDINMPRMNGKETLMVLKKDNVLSSIPVAVFSTSSNQADKNFFSKYDVELVTKPSNMSSIYKEVKKLLDHCSE